MPQLIITFGEGPTSVTGPIENKEMCYHVLLDAALAIMQHDPKKVIPAGALPFPFDPRKGGRG